LKACCTDDVKGLAMAPKASASVTPEKKDALVATEPAAPEAHATETPPPEMTAEQRHDFASKLVDRFAVWAGAAGLIPLPVVDVAAVGGLQLQMLHRISQIYGVPFSANTGKALIAALVGTIVPASSTLGAASLLKSVPVVGTVISALVMPALASGATYAIGKVFIQHFASGGTLLDFNPPDYREYIKVHYREFVQDQKEMWTNRKTPAHEASATAASDTSKTATATT
jgi:uncharacterized protein (DUF697 family)